MNSGQVVGLCAAAVVMLGTPTSAAAQPAAQPSGRAGCVNTRGREGCVAASSMGGLEPTQIVVSPNGRFLYASEQAELLPPRGAPHSRLLVFARDPRSGALRLLAGRRGCLEDTPQPVARQRGPCERVGGLEQPYALAMSPDGRRLYVSSAGGRFFGGNYLVTYAVNPRTGTLAQVQCLASQVHSRCALGPVAPAGDLVVSSDSHYVYASDGTGAAIDVYRAGAQGVVFAQCLAGTTRPGRSCAIVPPLSGIEVEGLAQTGDGSELYAGGLAGNDADRIVGLVRSPTGLLGAASGPGGCTTDELTPPAGCTRVALTGTQLSFSASGKTLYAASGPELAVGALTRDPVTGALSEAAPAAGCVEFSSFPTRECPVATRWSGDTARIVSSPSGALLISAVDQHDNAEAVVEVSPSPAGGALAANDLRGCPSGRCRRLRGATAEMAGALAISPDGRSVYVAGADGLAQIRIPRRTV